MKMQSAENKEVTLNQWKWKDWLPPTEQLG